MYSIEPVYPHAILRLWTEIYKICKKNCGNIVVVDDANMLGSVLYT